MGTGNKKNPPPPTHTHVYIQTRCSFLVIYDLLTHGNFDNPLSKNPRKYFLTFIFPNISIVTIKIIMKNYCINDIKSGRNPTTFIFLVHVHVPM